MAWPQPIEYQAAIQNPDISFLSPELKRLRPALNSLGLPVVSTGNFACVFKMEDNPGPVAIRCFIRQNADQQRRYKLISQYLPNLSLPYFVGFEYIEQGIKIQNNIFPVIKMEWVEGKTLNQFAEENLHNSKALRDLTSRLRKLIKDLRNTKIAHGDLQHGNIIVVNKEIFLVDYDNLFIPDFRGEQSPELGHSNYQHPKRSPQDYDESLDNFSALVIYISILALAIKPRLWGKFHNGDNLLFTKEDYINPPNSQCFKELSSISETKELVDKLRDFCLKPLCVPYLEDIIPGLISPPKPKEKIKISIKHVGGTRVVCCKGHSILW